MIGYSPGPLPENLTATSVLNEYELMCIRLCEPKKQQEYYSTTTKVAISAKWYKKNIFVTLHISNYLYRFYFFREYLLVPIIQT